VKPFVVRGLKSAPRIVEKLMVFRDRGTYRDRNFIPV
jgi:hypothetical protein